MPWKVSNPMSERIQFVARLVKGDRMTDVCRDFGVSRKTGYKIWQRYQQEGLDGFGDRSRRPLSVPHETPRTTVGRVLELRKQHPTWGPKKLKQRLETLCPDLAVPAVSTIGEILKREGLVKSRARRRRASPTPTLLSPGKAPNDLWAMDFKGEFKLGNGKYCYPLTITDDRTRFVLCCHALSSTKGQPTQAALIETFRQYGLPTRIRSDNGSPFASTGRLGVTQLSVWLMRLGIELERTEPGSPQQNGRHERMHRTLKADCPKKQNMLAQQEAFDDFCTVFNEERPHEALGFHTPSKLYVKSSRAFPEQLPLLEYAGHQLVRRVYGNGHALVPGRHDKDFYVGAAFAQQTIGLNQLTPQTWEVDFMGFNLGLLDIQTNKLIDLADSTNH